MNDLDALLAALADVPEPHFASSPERLRNLREYLAALQHGSFSGDLLVGDACLSQSACLTGIPFTSEFLLRADAHPFLAALRPRLWVKGNQFEQASYDLWMALGDSQAVPALWQFVHLKVGDDAEGCEASLFRHLLRVLKPRRIFAWGEDVADFLGRQFPELEVRPLIARRSSWHEEALRLDLEWHGVIKASHEESQVSRGSELGQLYLKVLPRHAIADTTTAGREEIQNCGVAAAGVLDDQGRFTFFRHGQTAMLARMLQQARQVVGYDCFIFDFELIRGETKFKRPPALDLRQEIEDATGKRLSFQNVVRTVLGILPGSPDELMRELVAQAGWENLSLHLETYLTLLTKLHHQLSE